MKPVQPWLDHDAGVRVIPRSDGGFDYQSIESDKMTEKRLVLRLTPEEAKYLWNVVDGQLDAGACEGGNTPDEVRCLRAISYKVLPYVVAQKSRK